MKKILLSTVACATMMLAASDYKYEITPMVGGNYTEGNLDLNRDYVNAGINLGFNLFDSVIDQVELGYLRSVEDVKFRGENRDTGITKVFTNFVKDYDLSSDLSLYSLVGVGAEIFDDEYADNENSAFGNYGAGVKYKLADQATLKFDVRHAIEIDHGDNNLSYNVGVAVPFGAVEKPAPVVEAPKPVVVPAPVVEAPKDSDNDGIVDAKDECPDTMARVSVDATGCATLVNLEINFDTNSSVIKNSYSNRIGEFANMMKANPKLKATIEAHTDSTASDAYNMKLSNKRAQATVDYLKKLDVEASRLKAVGYGESKPIASNATKEGRAKNRRVTAVMSK